MDDQARVTRQTTDPWSPHQPSNYPSPEPRDGLQCLSVAATQLLSLKHVLKHTEQTSVTCKSSESLLFSAPALGEVMQRLKILEDKTVQVNAATMQKVESDHFPMLHGKVRVGQNEQCICMIALYV